MSERRVSHTQGVYATHLMEGEGRGGGVGQQVADDVEQRGVSPSVGCQSHHNLGRGNIVAQVRCHQTTLPLARRPVTALNN